MTNNCLLLPLVRKAVTDANRAGYFMAPSRREGHGPYRLTIVDGKAVACGCKGHNFHGHCVHRDDYNAMALTVAG